MLAKNKSPNRITPSDRKIINCFCVLRVCCQGKKTEKETRWQEKGNPMNNVLMGCSWGFRWYARQDSNLRPPDS